MRPVALVPGMLFVLLALAASSGASQEAPAVRIVEVVADPQDDWNRDGGVTTSDEWVELHNVGTQAVDVTGWRLVLEDTTPEEATLAATIAPGGRLVVLNPPGALNNDAGVRLIDAAGVERDAVAYGSFDAHGTVPSASADSVLDEALALVEGTWTRQHATPGTANADPFVRASVSFPGASPWDVAPGEPAAVEAVVRHAHVSIQTLTLSGVSATGNATPGHEAAGSWQAQAPGSGQHVVELGIAGGGADWTWPVGVVRVDTTAPPVPVASVPRAVNTTTLVAVWPAVEDTGVGGVTYDAAVRVDGVDATRWRNVTGLAVPHLAVEGLEHGGTVTLRVRAVDAADNASPWSAANRTLVDRVPPPAPASVSVTGRHETRLSWTASQDADAGTVGYVVLRRHGGTTASVDVGDVTVWVDPEAPSTAPLDYGVMAVDAAGNPSAVTWTVAEHEALRPHVLGVRIKKAVWTSGIQELRVDFDRVMDTDVFPHVVVAGEQASGSWFANRTTYFVRLGTVADHPQGPVWVNVTQAQAEGGLWMTQPYRTGFVVDTEPPTVAFDDQDRHFDAWDAVDPAPRVFVKVWPEDEAAPPAFVLWSSGMRLLADLEDGRWVVRYYAQDAAGLRSSEAEVSLVVAPTPAATTVEDAAAGSGDDPQETPAAGGQAPRPAPEAATADQGGSLDGVLTEREDLAPEAPTRPVWPWALLAGGLTSGGAAMALRHRMHGRRLPGPPEGSVADRIRAIRRGAGRSGTGQEPGRTQDPTGRRGS